MSSDVWALEWAYRRPVRDAEEALWSAERRAQHALPSVAEEDTAMCDEDTIVLPGLDEPRCRLSPQCRAEAVEQSHQALRQIKELLAQARELCTELFDEDGEVAVPIIQAQATVAWAISLHEGVEGVEGVEEEYRG